MKINATLPFDRTDSPEEFLQPEAVTEIGSLLERVGFNGGNVTDHPCPTGRWLDAGGHHAQDPFVMLALVAAATRTLRLHTGILVLPTVSGDGGPWTLGADALDAVERRHRAVGGGLELALHLAMSGRHASVVHPRALRRTAVVS